MKLSAARRAKTSAGIFTSSMADVVFLLIVFFVLTYQVSPDTTRMQLPKSLLRTEVPRDAAMISVSPPKDGEILRVSTGDERAIPVASAEEVVSFAANLVSANADQAFIIRADKGVRYERIDAVLQALKDAHARKIFLLSEQKTVESS